MNRFINPRVAVAGICLMALGWLALTLLFEFHMGLPASGVQWAKRLVGWGVELWFIRVLAFGFVRCRNLPAN
jgi:hypothetical protein